MFLSWSFDLLCYRNENAIICLPILSYQCSAPCGKGERTREVVCQALTGQPADDKQCSRRGRKPALAEVCDLGSCGVGWFYTQWPEHVRQSSELSRFQSDPE